MRVLIVDDDRLVSSSLKTILEADGGIEVVGTGSSGSQAIALYGEYRPDILLMDIRMDGMTGIEVAEILLKQDPGAKILFLTTFSDDDYIIKALQIGAKGYLLKQNFESIVPSIKTVAIGQRVFGDEIITKIPAMIGDSSKEDFKKFDLSEKETEIMTQVANGLSNKEIAETLFLSEGTVRNYISVILEKLGLRDRTQLAIFYYKHS
ncbi:response regulator transcription factor [Caproiciproducens faecalis]|uniref:Stage 0 sporulation protein A homolog n=1 Tax=Caproiciproducens faecalis TaxID=2820301 RepID=A0ABS7DLJ5_9FIRM|nr:response regulator transcription factor [Caproiciproducens faecalis]